MDETTLLDATNRILSTPERTMRYRAKRAHQRGDPGLSYVGGRWVAPLAWWRSLCAPN